MIAAALLAQTQLWWRQFAWLIEQLGAAAEQTREGEIWVFTGRDWAGAWVA